MIVEYTRRAEADLAEIHAYLAERNPSAAWRTIARITTSIGILEHSPLIGRPGRISGTREWFVSGTRYVVVYRIERDAIEILNIVHTGRDRR